MLIQRYNTLFIGKVFLSFPLLKSTNKYALNLLAKSKPTEGTVISTTEQVAGRGQIDSIWESEPRKNITLSVILYPVFLSAREQFMLNKAVSLAVWDWAMSYLPDLPVKIKWPNDLYVANRKMAGILIQNNLKGQQINASVIGIGINVNQTLFRHAPNPTSLAKETGEEYSIETLSQHLCKTIEVRYLQLRNGQHEVLDTDYRAVLFGLGEERQFRRMDDTAFSGKICGVGPDGRLQIETAAGLELFSFKEVVFVH